MKITYNENPLRTTVELDDHEKEILRLKVVIRQQEYAIAGAHFYLDDDYFDVDRARSELKYDAWEGKDFEDDITKLCQDAIDNLLDVHCGDCTCVAMSCSKCRAESLVGVDTMPGLRKHEASLIGSYYGWKPEHPKVSIHEVIDKLEVYCQKPIVWDDSKQKGHPEYFWNKEIYEKHTPRWTQERENALVWLKNYRDTYFAG